MNYVGSRKHKQWVPGGAFGSICPSFTHTVKGRNFGCVAPELWKQWPKTVAQHLLQNSVLYNDKRYAADHGIAFCAQETGNGNWHGYPLPWKQVPNAVCRQLVAQGQTTEKEIKHVRRRQKAVDPRNDNQWAMQ